MTFKQSSIWLLVVTLIVFVVIVVFHLSYALLLLPFIVYLFLLVRGAIFIGANFFIRSHNQLPLKRVDGKHTICLSFDDGIHPEFTPRVLDILKQQQVRAMFFLIGKTITGNEALLKRMADEGHMIGNHSDSHSFWFDLLSTQQMILDLNSMNERVAAILSKSSTPTFFRPPYGVTNPNLAAAIKHTGMQSVGWSLRSMDTVASSREVLLEKLKAGTKPGVIVLLHDRCQVTADTLTDYIVFCKEQGYIFTTLS